MPQEKTGVEHCPRRLPEVEVGEVGEARPRGQRLLMKEMR